jgi:hypothetical protein
MQPPCTRDRFPPRPDSDPLKTNHTEVNEMGSSITRRTALAAAAGSALAAAIHGPRAEAAPGGPLLLGRTNLAGSAQTVLRSRASGRPQGVSLAVLRVENMDPEGEGTGLFVQGAGHIAIDSYGQLGATAVRAVSNDGLALDAEGLVRFSYSGRVRFNAGQSTIRLRLSGQLALPGSANVLATLQGNGGAGVAVRFARRITPAPGAPGFGEVVEITLTRPAKNAVDVAFWLFETLSPGWFEVSGVE